MNNFSQNKILNYTSYLDVFSNVPLHCKLSIQMYCTFQSNLMQFSQQNLFVLDKKQCIAVDHLGLVVDVSISLSLATVWLMSYQIWALIFTVEVWNVKAKLYSGISENEFILKREVTWKVASTFLQPRLWTNHDCLWAKEKKRKRKDVNLKRICARCYKLRVVGNIKQSKGLRVWSNSKVINTPK